MELVVENSGIIDVLETVMDPEIPVLTVLDLGIIRNVEKVDGSWVVTITPTYSGCPAMQMIEVQIKAALDQAGYTPNKIITTLSPPWTTDWITEEGKKKLKAFGIAPPIGNVERIAAMMDEDKVIPCPHCGAEDTQLISQFGSTPCKAMYKCNACLEPFDYFKCH